MFPDRFAESLAKFVTASHWTTIDVLYSMTLPDRVISCPVCSRSSTPAGYRVHVAECQFGGGRLERYACPSCDFVFGPMKMLDATEQQLAADYALLYVWYDENDNTEAELRAFTSCRPAAEGLYLNWGSGAWSGTIDGLRAEGWDVWGYEPVVPPESPFVAGRLDEISAKFDGIFSNNMIEHLRDPVAAFSTMARYLKDDGLMVHATPCYELRYEDTRFHTSFYVGRSVDALADRVGLDVVAREGLGDYESVSFSVRRH